MFLNLIISAGEQCMQAKLFLLHYNWEPFSLKIFVWHLYTFEVKSCSLKRQVMFVVSTDFNFDCKRQIFLLDSHSNRRDSPLVEISFQYQNSASLPKDLYFCGRIEQNGFDPKILFLALAQQKSQNVKIRSFHFRPLVLGTGSLEIRNFSKMLSFFPQILFWKCENENQWPWKNVFVTKHAKIKFSWNSKEQVSTWGFHEGDCMRVKVKWKTDCGVVVWVRLWKCDFKLQTLEFQIRLNSTFKFDTTLMIDRKITLIKILRNYHQT